MVPAKKIFSARYIKKAFRHLFRQGPRSFAKTAYIRLMPYDVAYDKWYRLNKPKEEELQNQRNHKFTYIPKISILVPVYNTPERFLVEMIESVIAQTYTNWQLCIADGNSSELHVDKILQRYAEQDERICITKLQENSGISANTNAALKLADGEYIALLDHDDVLPPEALYEVAKAMQQLKYDVIYSDEDIVTHNLKHCIASVFKPDFSPHLLECHNYITHFLVIKKSVVDKIGGFRKKYDGSQDYDMVFRSTEIAIENSIKLNKSIDKEDCVNNRNNEVIAPYANTIHHIPKILYHWRSHKGSVAGDSENKIYAYENGKTAIEDHFSRTNTNAIVKHAAILGRYQPTYLTPGGPLVSIIIPNMDHVDDLKKCIDSLLEINTYKNIEIIIVENNSKNQNTFKYYEKLEQAHGNIKTITYEGEFNFSKINNKAVKHACGQYLLFLNNDTELISPNGIADMLGIAMKPEVGAVGAKLLYADNTVQHAGVVVGFGGFAGHVFHNFHNDDPGYNARPLMNCDYSVVTAACMMVPAAIFKSINGFTEDFKVGLNDVDLCLKIRRLGKYVVYNAFSQWHHYESKSRGIDEDDPDKKERLCREIELFQSLWPEILQSGDPFYNINFPIDYDAFCVKPEKDKRLI